MSTVYDCDLHDVGMSTFQRIQQEALDVEHGRMLADQADDLERRAKVLPPAQSQAIRAEAARIRRQAHAMINGEGAVEVTDFQSMGDAGQAQALEANAAKLLESAKLLPSGAAQPIIASANALLAQATALRGQQAAQTQSSGSSVAQRWNSLGLIGKLAVGALVLAPLGFGAYKLATRSK